MVRASVKELRENLRSFVERAEAGEEVVILERGREVARLVPPEEKVGGRFPDLTEFRASIELKGESLSETVIRERREARY
jgi:prevent-host-death family protein